MYDICHRIKEHKKCKTSSCFQHEENEGHFMDYENVKVIDSAESDFKLRIKKTAAYPKRRTNFNQTVEFLTQLRDKILNSKSLT